MTGGGLMPPRRHDAYVCQKRSGEDYIRFTRTYRSSRGVVCASGRLASSQALYQGVPGKGVLLTQAELPSDDSPVYPTADALLTNETDPTSILQVITDPPNVDVGQQQTALNGDSYPNNEVHQYGCVDLQGRAAGYTGASIKPYYFSDGYSEESLGLNYTQEDDQGASGGNITYSAQANTGTSPTVPLLVLGFTGLLTDSPLADRFFKAVTAVDTTNSNGSEHIGDARCEPIGVPAFGAFIHVDNADASEFLHIDVVGVDDGANLNPFDSLLRVQ